MSSIVGKKKALTFQELLFTLQKFWAEHGCVLQQPYDLEVGAGILDRIAALDAHPRIQARELVEQRRRQEEHVERARDLAGS